MNFTGQLAIDKMPIKYHTLNHVGKKRIITIIQKSNRVPIDTHFILCSF